MAEKITPMTSDQTNGASASSEKSEATEFLGFEDFSKFYEVCEY